MTYPTRRPRTAREYVTTRMKDKHDSHPTWQERPELGGGTSGHDGHMEGQSMHVHRLLRSLSAQLRGTLLSGENCGGDESGKFIWNGLPMAFSSPRNLKKEE